MLSVEALGVTLDGHDILEKIEFEVTPGTWVGILGPNGSGKTTLLRALAGNVPYDGRIYLDDRPLDEWSGHERARRMAFLRQAPSLSFDFSLEDLVLLGRTPHKGWLRGYNSHDRDRVRRALQHVDLNGMEHRSVLSLSGGETQRVFLAQALVQEAALLLLDEPTAHLDVHYQFAFMEQVASLVNAGRTILAVFHDLELAARYADRLLVLQDGRLRTSGPPSTVLTPSRIADIFGMRARVASRKDGGLRIDYLGPVSSDEPKTDRPVRGVSAPHA